MIRRIPLGALRVFEAAARCGSFKKAAAELSVTPGAVSRQIAALEARLKANLFERLNREVKLTESGRAYFNEIQAGLARIDAASERLGRRSARQLVRVDATPTFALHWLIPRLPDFYARYHGIDVDLSTSVGPIERKSDFEWIVRRDPEHFRGLEGEAFLNERSRLVASPATARSRRIRRPEDLTRCRMIEIKARSDLWPSWFRANGIDGERFSDRFELDQTIFAIQAALEGLGVAVLPELFVADLLKAGSLVNPMREPPVTTGAYHLMTAKPHSAEAAMMFRDWIRGAALLHSKVGGE